MLEGDETWEANELVEIGIVDNDDAFAIGVAACSSEEAKSGGMKGIGVELAHACARRAGVCVRIDWERNQP